MEGEISLQQRCHYLQKKCKMTFACLDFQKCKDLCRNLAVAQEHEQYINLVGMFAE